MALTAFAEKVSNLKPDITPTSQIHSAIRGEINQYIEAQDNLPAAVVGSSKYRLMTNMILGEIGQRRISFTQDNIDSIVDDLSPLLPKDIGVDNLRLFVLNSIFSPLNDDAIAEFVEIRNGDVPTAIQNQQLYDAIDDALYTLTPRERRVIELRFGFYGGGPGTLEKVGKELKVTRERIRQIEAKALRKLRSSLRSGSLQLDKSGDVPQENKTSVLSATYHPHNYPEIKRNNKMLRASGIREIGDFFSASPEEIASEWIGESLRLKQVVNIILYNPLIDLYSESKEDQALPSDQLDMLRHISDAVLYRDRDAALESLAPIERAVLVLGAETLGMTPFEYSIVERRGRQKLFIHAYEQLRQSVAKNFPRISAVQQIYQPKDEVAELRMH